MNIPVSFRSALRRAGELLAQAVAPPRRTLAMPAILPGIGPRPAILPKATPANLRRFGETPVARKAINTIKDRVAGMKWRIQPKNGRALSEVSEGTERVRLLTDNFDSPNSNDSFRSLAEQVLEDIIVGGFGAIEMQLTGDAARPLALWPVDGATILMRPEWDGAPDSTRYVQLPAYSSSPIGPLLQPGLTPLPSPFRTATALRD